MSSSAARRTLSDRPRVDVDEALEAVWDREGGGGDAGAMAAVAAVGGLLICG